jgi:hypothetical protein
MSHDVFISYASADKPVALSVCAALEKSSIRCWIAPRDVQPGISYAEALIDGINKSRVIVLIFTSHTSASPHVMREIERAVSKGVPIVPLRVEKAAPSKDLEYFISSTHWLDALEGPMEVHLKKLAETVAFLLASGAGPRTAFEPNDSPESKAGAAAVAPKLAPVAPKAGGIRLALWAGLAVLIVALGAGGFWFWRSHQHPPAPPPAAVVLSPMEQLAQTVDKLSTGKIPNASDPKASDAILPELKSLRTSLEESWMEKSSNSDEARLRKKILWQSGEYLNALKAVSEKHPDVKREAGLALARLGELQFSESQPELSDKTAALSSFHAAATLLAQINEASPADARVASSLQTVQQRVTLLETPPADATPSVDAKADKKADSKTAKAEPPPTTKKQAAVTATPAAPANHPPPVTAAKNPPPVKPQPAPQTPAGPPDHGVLHYSGPPVPFNGTVEFGDLPAEKLKFNFDQSIWGVLKIEKQPNGLKKLILHSKAQGVQTTCDGTWEIAK